MIDESETIHLWINHLALLTTDRKFRSLQQDLPSGVHRCRNFELDLCLRDPLPLPDVTQIEEHAGEHRHRKLGCGSTYYDDPSHPIQRLARRLHRGANHHHREVHLHRSRLRPLLLWTVHVLLDGRARLWPLLNFRAEKFPASYRKETEASLDLHVLGQRNPGNHADRHHRAGVLSDRVNRPRRWRQPLLLVFSSVWILFLFSYLPHLVF